MKASKARVFGAIVALVLAMALFSIVEAGAPAPREPRDSAVLWGDAPLQSAHPER